MTQPRLSSVDNGASGDGTGPDIDALARRLDRAWETGTTIEPLTDTDALTSPSVAYAVQERWSALREAEHGDRIIGRKIGLTSKPMQEQMKVTEPDYGSVWASRHYPARRGRVEVPTAPFIQPLAEGELAFLFGRPLRGTDITPVEVLAATEAVAVSVEIIDSRITDWRIKLPDTVADNASYGGITVGPWDRALRHADLATVGMVIHHNGEPVQQGVGAAALGHPARAVAWLVNKLGSLGIGLRAGDIVLSGSLCRSIRVRAGDVFHVQASGQPGLTVTFG
jgi:2-keto-4-pentenoate hydratase